MPTMTPEQALKIPHDLAESVKLTGPERDHVRGAAAIVKKAITPEVQATEDASDAEMP